MPSRRHHTGWLPDVPDFRDYSAETESVRSQLQRVGVADTDRVAMAESVDLRRWCSPVEDQGSLDSCTANAGTALVEFFERKAFGKHIDASRLFLYKTTRNLMGWTGDTGAFLRDTMHECTLRSQRTTGWQIHRSVHPKRAVSTGTEDGGRQVSSNPGQHSIADSDTPKRRFSAIPPASASVFFWPSARTTRCGARGQSRAAALSRMTGPPHPPF